MAAAATSAVACPSMEDEQQQPSGNKKRSSSSSVLGTLREAVNKVRFLLSFSATRWMLLTSVGAARGAPPPRRGLSFGSQPPPGLLGVGEGMASPASSSASSRTSRSASMGTASTGSLSPTSSAVASPEAADASSRGSPASSAGDSDIDNRADVFIANFRKHLQMERQVSLQLRYVRLNSA